MELRLPHPLYTSYTIQVASFDEGLKQFHIQPSSGASAEPTHPELHKRDIFWTEPTYQKPDLSSKKSTKHAQSGAESTPLTRIFWRRSPPSVGQVWLTAYGLLTLYPALARIQVNLDGPQAPAIGAQLRLVGLLAADSSSSTNATTHVLTRSSFWQGAGSPLSPRPAWLAAPSNSSPLEPIPSAFPRPPKPTPGTVIYSRFAPALGQHLSLVALDAGSAAHVRLFHAWNAHGTLEHHGAYLHAVHHDAATIPMLGYVGDAAVGYFEAYWVRERVEDELGAHFEAGGWDRGCSVLFAPRRADDEDAAAKEKEKKLWDAVVHYMFLDEPRTGRVFGAPRYVEGMRVGYEAEFPFNVRRRVDSSVGSGELAVCEREVFFWLCPFVAGEEGVGKVEREGRVVLARL